ncbi:DNA-directed DNA polymerase [Tanacetum coccineum]
MLSFHPEKLTLKGRRPREFHTTMSYWTFDSEKCSGQFRGKYQPFATFSLPTIGHFKLKPTQMSIQLADRSIKYPIGVCENLLVKFIFLIDFVVLEMDEDELVPIILGRPFLATARAVIDVHEGKLSLRVENETFTFNIGKSMKCKYSHDDYL